ncbi:MAG: hypothetical protein R3E65_05190 [Steroidobacteraceae bacterium]
MHARSRSADQVLGVGGGGGNCVTHMVSSGIEGVDFLCINTDAPGAQALARETQLQISSSITKGLGAGADPRSAARPMERP